MKDLTIYIPTYNRSAKLAKTLESICRDVDGKLENDIWVIVNDNDSTDDTSVVVNEYAKERPWLIYHKNSKNLGIVGNVYVSLELIKTLYMWIVSDDDYMYEGCFERVLQIIHEYNNTLEFVFLNFRGQFEAEVKNKFLGGVL